MALSLKSKRITIANFFAILAAALLMWVYTNRKSSRHEVPEAKTDVVKVAVDLSADGFRIDSLGKVYGRQKELLQLLLSDRAYELVPYSSRSEALQDIAKGAIQIYATTMPKSMAQNIDGATATEWLYTSNFSLLYKGDTEDLEKRLTGDVPVNVIVSQEDPSAITILENLAELNYPALKIEVSDLSPTDLGVKLAKGQIAYLMCGSGVASAIVAADSTILTANDVSFQLQQVWLINSEQTELISEVDSAIIANRGSEQWIRIINDKQ